MTYLQKNLLWRTNPQPNTQALKEMVTSVFLIFLIMFTNVTSAQTDNFDTGIRNALICFYNATGGDNWTARDNWNKLSDNTIDIRTYPPPGNPGSLRGFMFMQVATAAYIFALEISDNNLRGDINKALSCFVNINSGSDNIFAHHFDLNINQLSGEIKFNLSHSVFNALVRLNLAYNKISGVAPVIPSPELVNLNLRSNAFSSLAGGSAHFSTNSKLQELDLAMNSFSCEIPFLLHCNNLLKLYLGFNNFFGSIQSFTSNLAIIQINNNQLTNLSAGAFLGLTALRYISISENNFAAPMPDFRHCSQLMYLYAVNCRLSGPLSPFSNNSLLEEVILTNNELVGQVPSFSTLTNLRKLYLDKNRFSSLAGENFGSNSKLEELFLNQNLIRGPLPTFSVATITQVDMSNNFFFGDFPISVALAPNLFIFRISRNNVSGGVPDLFATNLKELDISFNIIHSISRLPTSLSYLNAQNNAITSAFPSFRDVSNLWKLVLSNNK
jgi:Leucine-rich repeat (LRR) protein